MNRSRQSKRAAFSTEHAGFHKRLHRFLEKQRITLRSLNQKALEIAEFWISPQQCLQELLCRRARQGVETDLLIVALAPPAVGVFGPIIDQKKHPGRRNA